MSTRINFLDFSCVSYTYTIRRYRFDSYTLSITMSNPSFPRKRRLDESKPVAEFPCRGPCYLKFLLSERVAGMFIGKGGANITDIENTTLTSIKLSPSGYFYPGTNDRCISVGGEMKSIEEVTRRLIKYIRDYSASVGPSGQIVVRLVGPNSSISSIIGRKGELIRELCADTGCSIKIQDRVENSTERIIDIKGVEEDALRACFILSRKIQDEPHIYEYSSVLGAGVSSRPNTPPMESERHVERPHSERPSHDYNYERNFERQQPSYREPEAPRASHQQSFQAPSYQMSSHAPTHAAMHAPPSSMHSSAVNPMMQQQSMQSAAYQPASPTQQQGSFGPSMELLSYRCSVEFLVPNKVAPSNDSLQSISHRSGATVTLSEYVADQPDRTINISGPLCGVQAAHILVIRLVADEMVRMDNLVH